VADRVEETLTAIRRAREARIDILVTSGGASVGDYDLVQQALAAERMSLSFWKIALRPGRPLMHGKLGAMNALGLPGNPVSAYVCALLFMVPLIRKLSGRTDLELPVESARLGSDQRANDERTDCLRATLEMGPDGVPVATAFPVQDSSLMAALARADCLLIREPFAPAARTGEACRIVRLPL
jgi:molybdopterin molybdotransferase